MVLVAVLGALGNILSGSSIFSAPLIPSIPFGAVSVSLALDLVPSFSSLPRTDLFDH